jgi:cellulose synthase/poly-beta-1,6-N-acetylglucosamine synthase-like glycosyltransferase
MGYGSRNEIRAGGLMATASSAILALAGLPMLAASLYLLMMAILARRPPAVPDRSCHLRFDVLVPAHNEEAEIASTVRSLNAVDYPGPLFRVIVVADNCDDRTAARAAEAGALVLHRNDRVHRGKGYALAYGFERSLRDNFADMMVVVDADTTVTPNLLRAFTERFDAGADVVQADYGVRNARASWRTRMMTIAFAAFHGVRSLARERLGLSCGLRGNGMAFSRRVLQAVPHGAFSVVEDLEYGLQLGYAGVRVHYVHEARVLGQMVSTERASRSQRARWEGGRRALAREHLSRLFVEAWQRRDPVLLDLAIDLLIPPLAELVAINAIGLALAWIAREQNPMAIWIWAGSAVCIIGYVGRAWQLSAMGLRGLLDLTLAPAYIVWKLMLRLNARRGHRQEWIRTTREVEM